jgi:hypothetical protein
MAPAVRGERLRYGGAVNAPMSDLAHGLAASPLFYDIPAEGLDYGAAMMVTMRAGAGEIFNAGCCGWVTGLIRGDAAVTTITRNVLNRFLDSAADR